MNWKEVVNLLRDISDNSDVQIAIYAHEENGPYAMSTEGEAEFYADDEIE